jgi:signal transduction histidine kinase
MKLRTQLAISVVIFGLALLIIAVSMITTNQQVDRLNNQEALANNIGLQTSELSYLSNDYLLYNESKQVDQWNQKFLLISGEVSGLSVDTPDQQALVNNIKDNQQQLEDVFTNVVAQAATGTTAQNNTLNTEYIQVSWDRLAVQTQGISFDSSQLSESLGNEADQQKQTNNLLTASLLGIFAVFLLTNYFLIYRSTMKRISTLQDGTRIIGNGNLDYSIEEKKGDEFYDLSHAFNQMTARLKSVTASKTDLEREVVERKRAEEQLKDAKLRAELYLDLMGHDISNMHQIMMGQLELAQDIFNTDGKLESSNREMIDTSLASLERCANLISNVRKLQRISSHDVKNNEISLDEVLTGVVKQYDGLHPEKAVKIEETGGRHIVMANELLRDVFSNLIGNAVKHSNGSKVDITVKLEDVQDSDKKYYKVSIEDNGPGIPDEMKDKVFNRLQRGDTRARGMGLGLYLVKTLVESYHGRVWVEDRVAGDHTKGSRFVVLLPAPEGSNGN